MSHTVGTPNTVPQPGRFAAMAPWLGLLAACHLLSLLGRDQVALLVAAFPGEASGLPVVSGLICFVAVMAACVAFILPGLVLARCAGAPGVNLQLVEGFALSVLLHMVVHAALAVLAPNMSPLAHGTVGSALVAVGA